MRPTSDWQCDVGGPPCITRLVGIMLPLLLLLLLIHVHATLIRRGTGTTSLKLEALGAICEKDSAARSLLYV